MLLELCVILRMVINDANIMSLDSYEIIPCEDSGEIQSDNSLKDLKGASPLDTIKDMEPKALWNHDPMTKLVPQPELGTDWIHKVPFRTPHSLTRLSKSYKKGFSPYFRKSDFEFERRSKPITLVAIRKNGLAQRKALYKASPDSTSGEVAELQSPYNDIGSFWKDVVNA